MILSIMIAACFYSSSIGFISGKLATVRYC